MAEESTTDDNGKSPHAFVTTQWTQLRNAANSQAENYETALNRLCEEYWYPLYAYVRRSRRDVEEAQDLTQGFFEFLLSKNAFKQVDQKRGRFRTFLLCSLRNFLNQQHRDANRLKRGGGQLKVPLEWEDAEGRYSNEPPDEDSPDRMFDRSWAQTLVQIVTKRLRLEYEKDGEQDRFEALRFTIDDPGTTNYGEAAKQLGLTETGARTAARKLRLRFRDLLVETISDQVEDPEDVDQEIRHLMAALG
ncbi:MAG: RNA polymerase sigma factor [Limisphaerales bacterium]